MQQGRVGALTAFVACALAASCKVKGFPDGQLCQMGVGLIYVAGSSLRNELVKCVAIVRDVSLDLQQEITSGLDIVNATCNSRACLFCDTSYYRLQFHCCTVVPDKGRLHSPQIHSANG